MSGTINRVYKVKVKDGKKVSLGVDGDIFIDKENAAIKLNKDLLTVLATKKYVDSENQKQDVKINKNAADISDLKNNVSLLQTSIVTTDITLTPISEVTFNPSFLKAILTVVSNKIISIDIYIHDLKTTIGDITTGNDLKFNVSLKIPDGYSMATDRGDFISVCDTGGNSFLTQSTKDRGFMNYKAYTKNLNIDDNISFDLTLYSNINYSKGSVDLYDLVINII